MAPLRRCVAVRFPPTKRLARCRSSPRSITDTHAPVAAWPLSLPWQRWGGRRLQLLRHGLRLKIRHESARARAEEQFVHKVGQDAVVWNQQGRTYAVVANAPRNELHQIATYVKLNSR